MNENIGAKGGSRDRKRHFKILKRNKEKLTKEQLEVLEKKVKKRQIINILTLVPIAVVGAIGTTVTGLKIAPSRKKAVVPIDTYWVSASQPNTPST